MPKATAAHLREPFQAKQFRDGWTAAHVPGIPLPSEQCQAASWQPDTHELAEPQNQGALFRRTPESVSARRENPDSSFRRNDDPCEQGAQATWARPSSVSDFDHSLDVGLRTTTGAYGDW